MTASFYDDDEQDEHLAERQEYAYEVTKDDRIASLADAYYAKQEREENQSDCMEVQKMNGRQFLKSPYCGTDGEGFREEFISYLEQIVANTNWQAMSDYTYFKQGALAAIKEIIAEIKDV